MIASYEAIKAVKVAARVETPMFVLIWTLRPPFVLGSLNEYVLDAQESSCIRPMQLVDNNTVRSSTLLQLLV
jgi:hypothetical protein